MTTGKPLFFRPRLLGLALLATLPAAPILLAQTPAATTYKTETEIYYHDDPVSSSPDAYQRKQCRLDIHYPDNLQGYSTLIWFHGGGLVKGRRNFPPLRDKGIALVAVGYRLEPEGRYPDFLEDAAAATAWTLENIGRRGGDPGKVFIGGLSAGGYLAAMVGMDERWLEKHGRSHRELAGIISVSGQATTHFNVKKWLGDTGPRYRPIIDENAPLYHVRNDVPPVCLIVGDRNLDLPARVEENALLAASLKSLRHPWVDFHELQGFNHSTIPAAAHLLIPGWIKRVSDSIDSKTGAPPRTIPAPRDASPDAE